MPVSVVVRPLQRLLPLLAVAVELAPAASWLGPDGRLDSIKYD